jgi:iron-sulfur cluster assembly protein
VESHELTCKRLNCAGDSCYKVPPFRGISDAGARCYDAHVATVEQPTLVTLTESAAAKVKTLMAEEPVGEAAVLRIAVQGGGCSGFQYALGFDRGAQEGDNELEVNGVEVVVDPFSAPYLAGTEIDWVEGLQAGFAINNPNVAASCGCGHSFQVEEGEAPESDAAGCGSGCH